MVPFIQNKPISPETRRMAIANGTCVSFCNQPKEQLATSGVSRRYVVAFVLRVEAFILATARESKAHFYGKRN